MDEKSSTSCWPKRCRASSSRGGQMGVESETVPNGSSGAKGQDLVSNVGWPFQEQGR